MCHALTQVIRTIKSFIKYKSATAGKFITKKKHRKALQNVEITGTQNKKNNYLNQRYLVSTTHILKKN